MSRMVHTRHVIVVEYSADLSNYDEYDFSSGETTHAATDADAIAWENDPDNFDGEMILENVKGVQTKVWFTEKEDA